MTTLAEPPAVVTGEAQVTVEKPRPWAWLAPLAAILGGTVAIGLHAARFGHWIVDDAAITFSYSRSVAEGLGPVLQPGAPPVEGFSDPTWMALLALGRVVGLFDRGTWFGMPDYVVFPKALALVLCAGILLACHAVAKKVSSRPSLITFAVGLVLAAIPSFVIWCFSGLENSLFALAVTWLAAVMFIAIVEGKLTTTKVAMWTGGIVAFAGLTRPEGPVYLAAYPLILLIRLRLPNLRASIRAALISIGTFAVPFGGYLVFRYLEFGRLLSNPTIAKSQGIPTLQDLTRSGELVQYAGALAVLVLVLTIGITLARPSEIRSGLIALLVPLGLAILAFSVMVPDWMAQSRFATPMWPLAALAGALATAETLRRTGIRGRALLTVGLVAALLPSGVAFADASDAFKKNPTIPMCYIADRLGRVFNEYADIIGAREATFLLPDLGGSGMTSRLHLIDMAGLTDKTIADYTKKGDMAGLRDHVFDEVKPTFIHSRGPWAAGTGISSDPRMARDYVEIYLYPNSVLPNGDWVRRDAVPDDATLQKLRDYAVTTMVTVEQVATKWPLRQCGPLTRGDTQLGRH